MFSSSPSNARFPSSRLVPVSILILAGLLLGALNFKADAAIETPVIALTEMDRAVRIDGRGFPPGSQIAIEGSITGGTGRGQATADAQGVFRSAIGIPEWDAAEQMIVTATSGEKKATATIRLTARSVVTPVAPTTVPPTTSAPRTAAVTQAPVAQTGPLPNGPTGNWRLIFGDDFAGPALDTSKWATCYHWGCEGANKEIETQIYSPANLQIGGGKLSLIASPGGRASGMIAQKQNYAFTYGYMEMRAQLPKCAGCWPAFWSIPDDLTWPPEIDIMEGLSDNSFEAMTNYHWEKNGLQQSGAKPYTSPTDLAAGYHTYGAEWSANKITWYIDGIKVNEFATPAVIAKVPMYVVANLAIDGSRGAGTAPAGAQMNIDYIRVWQRG